MYAGRSFSPSNNRVSTPNRSIIVCLSIIGLLAIVVLAVIVGLFIGIAVASGGSGSGSAFRLTPQQVANFEAGYARLVADMGGVYDPELLSEPEFYSRNLVGSFTAEQEQAISSSCGYEDNTLPYEDNTLPAGGGQPETVTSIQIFTRYVTQIVPLNRKKRNSGFSAVCAAQNPSPTTNLAAVAGSGRLCQIVPDNGNQPTLNQVCQGTTCSGITSNLCCCGISQRQVTVNAVCINRGTSWSSETVWIYGCAGFK